MSCFHSDWQSGRNLVQYENYFDLSLAFNTHYLQPVGHVTCCILIQVYIHQSPGGSAISIETCDGLLLPSSAATYGTRLDVVRRCMQLRTIKPRKRYECTLNDCGRQYQNTFDLYRHQRQKHHVPPEFYQQGKKQTFGIREIDPDMPTVPLGLCPENLTKRLEAASSGDVADATEEEPESKVSIETICLDETAPPLTWLYFSEREHSSWNLS